MKRPEYRFIVEHIGNLGWVYRASKHAVTFTQKRSEATRYSERRAQEISVRIGGLISEVETETNNGEAT